MKTSGKNLKVFMYETHDYMDMKPERNLMTRESQEVADAFIRCVRDHWCSGTVSSAKELTPRDLLEQRNSSYWHGYEQQIDEAVKDCTEEFYEEYMNILNEWEKSMKEGMFFDKEQTRHYTMTREEALLQASKYGLEREVSYCIDMLGYPPEEALQEWDCYQY